MFELLTKLPKYPASKGKWIGLWHQESLSPYAHLHWYRLGLLEAPRYWSTRSGGDPGQNQRIHSPYVGMGSWVLQQGWSRESEFWIQFEEPLHPILSGTAPGWRLFWLGGSAFLWANRCVSNQSVCAFLRQNSVLDLLRTCTLWLAEIPEPDFSHRCIGWLSRQRRCLDRG